MMILLYVKRSSFFDTSVLKVLLLKFQGREVSRDLVEDDLSGVVHEPLQHAAPQQHGRSQVLAADHHHPEQAHQHLQCLKQ